MSRLTVYHDAVQRAEQTPSTMGAGRELDQALRPRLAALGTLALLPRLRPPDLAAKIPGRALDWTDMMPANRSA